MKYLKTNHFAKLIRELHSIKLWLIVVTTVLLVKHFVSDVVWSSFLGSLIAMREGSEARQNYHDRKQKESNGNEQSGE